MPKSIENYVFWKEGVLRYSQKKNCKKLPRTCEMATESKSAKNREKSPKIDKNTKFPLPIFWYARAQWPKIVRTPERGHPRTSGRQRRIFDFCPHAPHRAHFLKMGDFLKISKILRFSSPLWGLPGGRKSLFWANFFF